MRKILVSMTPEQQEELRRVCIEAERMAKQLERRLTMKPEDMQRRVNI